ncbi:MAG: pyruvate kinase [Planctomycetales bacterium]
MAERLLRLRESMQSLERAVDVESIHAQQRSSARNLVHYVALRRHDLRELQDNLSRCGLSSLGRCESHVLENVETVLGILCQLACEPAGWKPIMPPPLNFSAGQALIEGRTEQLFGQCPPGRGVHIMVTMPAAAAGDYLLVRDLLAEGMSCMRINCSHDGPAEWQGMIENLRRAKQETGKCCRVAMDLGGPKLRTGPFEVDQGALRVRPGDRVLVTRNDPRRRFAGEAADRLEALPRISCTLSEIFKTVRPGERMLFDDGKIGAVIREVHDGGLVAEIARTRKDGGKLRADKGINLPDSELALAALTDKDLHDLKFAAEHADILSYSFVRRPEDVHRLQSELAVLGRPDMPIILKIENRQSFARLPSLLLAAMRSPLAGVMIARGDLAVEVGYERLAEVQEEILWTCEAAHMPVVWATQVLEQLAKEGLPSRAEVTDAAMSVRAECVMLNKGPYILDAVRTLSDILHRMQDHQAKKRPRLRRLRLADDLAPAPLGGISDGMD